MRKSLPKEGERLISGEYLDHASIFSFRIAIDVDLLDFHMERADDETNTDMPFLAAYSRRG